MVETIQISFAESAIQDLEDILLFYGDRNILHVGEKLVSKVIKDIELLRIQADMGRIVPEFELEYLRELIRPPFRIVYRRDQNRVRIVRIWRSERLMVRPS